jgi:hypothetical protein
VLISPGLFRTPPGDRDEAPDDALLRELSSRELSVIFGWVGFNWSRESGRDLRNP